MSKPRNVKRKANPPAPAPVGRRPFPLAVLGLAVVVVAIAGFWWSKGRNSEDLRATAPATAANSTNLTTTAASTNAKFDRLRGRWVRPDGGYILEIRSATAEGKLEAGYFNPRPINVAKAAALQDGQAVKVFVELRDVNYPGSTYTLVYDAASDQLQGIYYQAAMQQQFEVFFERQK